MLEKPIFYTFFRRKLHKGSRKSFLMFMKAGNKAECLDLRLIMYSQMLVYPYEQGKTEGMKPEPLSYITEQVEADPEFIQL